MLLLLLLLLPKVEEGTGSCSSAWAEKTEEQNLE